MHKCMLWFLHACMHAYIHTYTHTHAHTHTLTQTHTYLQAVSLFKEKPELFDAYHTGFRLQIKSWPQNPVDVIGKFLKKYPK